MFLSRVLLNPRHPAVRQDMASITAMHRTVMSAFGQTDTDARRTHGVLHRLEPKRDGSLHLFVQSLSPPDWSFLPEGYCADAPWGEDNPATRNLDSAWDALEEGMRLQFRLLANASRRIKRESGGSTRVPLREGEAQQQWLVRKGKEHGFLPDLSTLQVERPGTRRGRRDGTGVLTLEPILYDGVLRVEDLEAFRNALTQGIGPAKAYGCGLLSVARAGG